jgi:hypothetical protein
LASQGNGGTGYEEELRHVSHTFVWLSGVSRIRLTSSLVITPKSAKSLTLIPARRLGTVRLRSCDRTEKKLGKTQLASRGHSNAGMQATPPSSFQESAASTSRRL